MALKTNSPSVGGLSFTGMTHLNIRRGFDLQYKLKDKSMKVLLCVGREDNRVLVTGTTPASRQADVLNAIDAHGKWGQNINLWMVGEKNGSIETLTKPVKYKTHVKPFDGELNISAFAQDSPPLTYPGNGKGRLLSTMINNKYYFTHAGKLETANEMRGFDCTTFVMALFSISASEVDEPKYGSQLSDSANASPCGYERVSCVYLLERFLRRAIPRGIYILFSSGHVLLYNSNNNYLFEFTFGGMKYGFSGFRLLVPHRTLWWMRKLPELYRHHFL